MMLSGCTNVQANASNIEIEKHITQLVFQLYLERDIRPIDDS